ncbi:MAG: STM4015 family protein [Fibrella sp.]|nr:STM4015 family protein [Armatimonadota bacterium]
MGIYAHLTTWRGVPVVDWSSATDESLMGDRFYRIGTDWDEEEPWLDQFALFLTRPGVSRVTGLIVGFWGEEDGQLPHIVEAIAGAREKLTSLSALFIGDIIGDENEISWIRQTDLSPLLTAYPALEHLGVRGTQGLSLGIPKLTGLKSLTIESGGLPVSVIEEVSGAELPMLEHLELYLGTNGYGGDSSVDDLQTIFQHGPEKWPRLTYLGLRDCEYADGLAGAVAADGGVPVLRHVKTLDLSLGTLGDGGVRALAECPSVARLVKLDIHRHYASEASVALLTGLGITVDASDAQGEADEDDRYVAVSE